MRITTKGQVTTTKGQVTIPQEIREKMGFLPNTEVDFEIVDNTVKLVKVEHRAASRGDRLIGRMRGKATVRMTTEEIMALTGGER